MRIADPRVSQSPDVRSGSVPGRYGALVESTDGAIVVTSLDGTIVSWGAGAERLYGYSAEEALGQPLSRIVPADRAREAMNGLRSAGLGAHTDPVETIRVRRDQTRVAVSLTVAGIRDATDQIVGAMSVARDITAAKNTERLLGSCQAALADANVLLDKAERLSRTGTWVRHLGSVSSIFCSPESYRMLGLDDDTPITIELFYSFVHPDDRARVEAAMTTALAEHRSYEIEYRIARPDGITRWVHAWADPEYDDTGTPVRILGVIQDITDRHEADQVLRASAQRLRLLAENARDFIFRIAVRPEPHFEYASPASLAITGFTPEQLYENPKLGMTLVAPEHVHEIESAVLPGGASISHDTEVHRDDGTTIWVNEQLTFIRDENGHIIAVEGITRDITDRKRSEDERAHATLHDRLTGLPNRQLLHQCLELCGDRARTNGNGLFVISLDLDDFTLINDTYGFETGDSVLVAVAGLLTAATRGDMTVGRTGSDEFIIVGDATNTAKEVAEVVERIRRALGRPIRCNGIDLSLHVRIGIAVDDTIESPKKLERDSAIALTRAKQHRTETGVEFFDASMRTNAKQRLALVNDLYLALDRREFELWYQPIVRLADDRIIEAEALIRWHHPQRGLLNPTEFISLAEDTGLIVTLGAWVLAEACTQLRTWTDADPALAHLGIAVNLSVKQLRSSQIVSTVKEAVSRAGIEPGRLTVEMTESVFADDLEAIHGVLSELRALGVRIAIDDFGTGYSSLAYLKRLPLDTLKVDKSFVDDLCTDRTDAAIVGSAVTISRALGLFTVAEGVETPEQLAALRVLGCDAAQGFYFSKPVSSTEFVALVAEDPRDREPV